MAIKYAAPGSVSHGTLRTDDLINSFYGELRMLLRGNAHMPRDAREIAAGYAAERSVENYAQARAETLAAGHEWDEDGQRADDLLFELVEALNLFAPPGHYFSGHEGDGADFGFWPCEEQDPEGSE